MSDLAQTIHAMALPLFAVTALIAVITFGFLLRHMIKMGMVLKEIRYDMNHKLSLQMTQVEKIAHAIGYNAGRRSDPSDPNAGTDPKLEQPKQQTSSVSPEPGPSGGKEIKGQPASANLVQVILGTAPLAPIVMPPIDPAKHPASELILGDARLPLKVTIPTTEPVASPPKGTPDDPLFVQDAQKPAAPPAGPP